MKGLKMNNLQSIFYKQQKVLKKIMKTFISVVFLSVGWIQANDLVIINATIYSATDRGVINHASIVINDGVITEIQQTIDDKKILNAVSVIDAKGQIVTPGFIGVMNQLGLVEVNSELNTQDGSDKNLGISFDPSLAYNSNSTLIPLARQGGVTGNISSPRISTSLFAGQSFYVNLSTDDNNIEQTKNAVVVRLGRQKNASRAHNIQLLQTKLANAKNLKASKYSQEQQVLSDVLAKKKPLLIYANRASDLLKIIELKKQFDIKVIIVGAGDAVRVKNQLADAKIPLIIKPINNLPSNFDTLHQSIYDAGILSKAGIKLIFRGVSGHYLEQTRYNAGNAVANGMEYQQAIEAISANVADIFSLNTGRIEVGSSADLVLWKGDPLDLNSRVQHMWIKGKHIENHTRQDSLRKRYQEQSDMPAAYVN